MTSKFSKVLRFAMIATMAVAIGSMLSGPRAFAFGSSSDDSEPSVAKMIDEAEDYIDDEKYEDAIAVLDKALAEDSENADVLNYLGYSYRKLGDRDKALEYYLAALAEQPEHLGANEYLGELYLEMDNLAKAEERLAVLADSCNSDCEEFDELNEAIADYKEAHGIS